jgi:hypothetical protein
MDTTYTYEHVMECVKPSWLEFFQNEKNKTELCEILEYVEKCRKKYEGWKLLDEILTNANYINCKNISTIIILCILS